MARVTVFGLDMDAALVPRVVAALRGTYPTLTAGLTDRQAGLAVIRHWVRSTVMAWEAKQAAPDPGEAGQQAATAAVQQRAAARGQAETDTADIQLPSS